MATHPHKKPAFWQYGLLPAAFSFFGLLSHPTIADRPVIENGSFEIPPQRDRLPLTRFQKCPTGAGWAFFGHSGIACNGSIFALEKSGHLQPTPAGSQFAFLQSREDFGAGLEERVWGWQSNQLYVISLLARREGWQTQAGISSAAITLDGVAVASVSPAGEAWEHCQTAPFATTQGSHVLGLSMPAAEIPAGVMLDDVRVEILTNNSSGQSPLPDQGATNSTR